LFISFDFYGLIRDFSSFVLLTPRSPKQLLIINNCLLGIPITQVWTAKELWKEDLAEGLRNNPSVPCLYYSLLARRNDATLITSDGTLANICKALNISVCY
jgi:hypothetical protein